MRAEAVSEEAGRRERKSSRVSAEGRSRRKDARRGARAVRRVEMLYSRRVNARTPGIILE